MISDSWQKSSYSSAKGEECLEARSPLPRVVDIRDSKRPDTEILTFPAEEWISFVQEDKV